MSMTKLKPGEEVEFLKEIHGASNYEGLFGVVKDAFAQLLDQSDATSRPLRRPVVYEPVSFQPKF